MKRINGIVIVENAKYFNYFGINLSLNNEATVYRGLARQWPSSNTNIEELDNLILQAHARYSRCLLCEVYIDLREASQVLNHINAFSAQPDRYELIAIYSQSVTKAIGAINFDTSRLNSIGYDIESEWAGYIIREELFTKNINGKLTERFQSFVNKLNSNGLFNSKKTAIDFVNSYFHAQKDCNLEKILPEDYELIEIFVVQSL